MLISLSVMNTWLDKIERHLYGVKAGVMVEGQELSGLLPDEVQMVVEELAIKNQALRQEPGLDKDTGKVIPPKPGKIIDVEATVEKILAAEEYACIELEEVLIQTEYSAEDLEQANQPLGYYETWIGGTFSRHTNISLAAQGINNIVVWPKEPFSFNEVVGPRSVERGYLPAPIILMGSRENDFGGGVCQVSSTLYNAVLKAGLQVIERHPHSRRVAYVPAGMDAAVDYGSLDFKFANNLEEPIIVKAGTSQGKVWVKILGREKRV
jgi:vancomycin resistance protein YoaR